MQVLIIPSAHEHRIETHPDEARAPDGMKEWGGVSAEHTPFQQVWAVTSLHDETVSEIINGYAPPPGEGGSTPT